MAFEIDFHSILQVKKLIQLLQHTSCTMNVYMHIDYIVCKMLTLDLNS